MEHNHVNKTTDSQANYFPLRATATHNMHQLRNHLETPWASSCFVDFYLHTLPCLQTFHTLISEVVLR